MANDKITERENNTRVIYIPLDNRTVNYDRAIYLAHASGIEIIMPDADDLSTTLYNPGEDPAITAQGNPKNILDWLKNQDGEYYVISLDQIFSGGLAGSRDPFYDSLYTKNLKHPPNSIASLNGDKLLENGKYVLSETEKAIADHIIALAETKKLFLFDTVMRLATTIGYGMSGGDEYTIFRDVYAGAARKQLYGDDLTVENIIAEYDHIAGQTVKLNGWYRLAGYEELVPLTGVYKITQALQDSDRFRISFMGDDEKVYSCSVDQEYKNSYNLARERKLKIIEYLLADGMAKKLRGLYMGVDDSKEIVTIQTNEKRYITEKLLAGSNALLFDGADELSLVGLSDVVTTVRGKVKVKTLFFGGHENDPADEFGTDTLKECVGRHAAATGGIEVDEGEDMQILVLTRSTAKLGYHDEKVCNDAINALINQLKINQANKMPTCIIDGHCSEGNSYGRLADGLLEADGVNLSEVMGFSAWNTAGNASGIALSNAIARVSYLKNHDDIPKTSHEGFFRSIIFAYIKDNVYRRWARKCYDDPSYFYAEAGKWLAAINKNPVVYTDIVDGKGVSEKMSKASVANLNYTWNRYFEADFRIII